MSIIVGWNFRTSWRVTKEKIHPHSQNYRIQRWFFAIAGLSFGLLGDGGTALSNTIEVRKITIQSPDDSIPPKVWGFADEETRATSDGRQTRETNYKNARGEIVQKDVTTFNPDSLEVTAYRFENFISGELVEVATTSKKVRISSRESKTNPMQTQETQWKSGSAFGKLLDRWILKNRESLAKGQFVPIELYIPSKADSYGFRLRLDNSGAPKDENRYVMEARNWFIRWFIPRVELRFEKSPPYKLRGIVGPYPLLNEVENQGKQALFAIE